MPAALKNGGAFLRAQLTLIDNHMSTKFVVRRGGHQQKVEPPADMLVPVALLFDVPIYVEIAYLKEISGWLLPA